MPCFGPMCEFAKVYCAAFRARFMEAPGWANTMHLPINTFRIIMKKRISLEIEGVAIWHIILMKSLIVSIPML